MQCNHNQRITSVLSGFSFSFVSSTAGNSVGFSTFSFSLLVHSWHFFWGGGASLFHMCFTHSSGQFTIILAYGRNKNWRFKLQGAVLEINKSNIKPTTSGRKTCTKLDAPPHPHAPRQNLQVWETRMWKSLWPD